MLPEKPPLTLSQQVELLENRGLIIKDKKYAENFLSLVNYYHFSGYSLSFEKERHKFIPGTTFEQVVKLLEFDSKLRQEVFKYLGIIEIVIRTKSAYYFSHSFNDPFAHEKHINFRTNELKYKLWIEELHTTTKKSKEIFIDHFRKKYQEKFPAVYIWVAVELMSFGLLSRFIEYMHIKEQKLIADDFKIPPSVLVSWLKTFCYIRNICAHHSRLWNRQLSISPSLPKSDRWKNINSRLFGYILYIINHMIFFIGNDYYKEWQISIESLIDNHPEVPNFWKSIGLLENWKENSLWRGEI